MSPARRRQYERGMQVAARGARRRARRRRRRAHDRLHRRLPGLHHAQRLGRHLGPPGPRPPHAQRRHADGARRARPRGRARDARARRAAQRPDASTRSRRSSCRPAHTAAFPPPTAPSRSPRRCSPRKARRDARGAALGGAHAHRPPRRRARQVRPDDLAGDRDRGGRRARRRRRRPRSRTSTSAAPTRPARTTATSRAWPRCSRACRNRSAGVTLNRLCASGLAAISAACHAVIAGDGDLFVAGGVESMSRAPLVTAKPERAFPRGDRVLYDSTLGWRFPNPAMEAMFPLESMGETGENVAERYDVTREDQDAFALRSQQRWAAAQAAGRFADELDPRRRRRRSTSTRGPTRRRRRSRSCDPAFRAGRQRHGGQLERHQRRRRRARDRERGEGPRARHRAARGLRRQRRRGRRPARHGHRADPGRAQAAGAHRRDRSASSTWSS